VTEGTRTLELRSISALYQAKASALVLPRDRDDLARRLVEEFGGQLGKTTGDGILATFDGLGPGICCAAALRDELRGIGLQIRVRLHTGEVEQRNRDVGSITVHIAARVMAVAGPGEILTSRTVRDRVVGSDLALDDHGVHPLKGVESGWQLFTVTWSSLLG
jgi:class 3 adenylate cyclase